jgi:acyl carrier protein
LDFDFLEGSLAELGIILTEVFNKPQSYFVEDKAFKDIDGWDSFSHMSLILRVEEDFGINLTEDEIVNIMTVRDLLKAIESKTVKQ